MDYLRPDTNSNMTKLNRYICSFGTTKLSVDAPNMYTAIKYAIDQKGVEPNTVILGEIGIAYAQASADVTFQAIVETIDGEVPGDVYPREGVCPVGNKIYFTAMARDGYKFLAFTTPTGHVVGTDMVMEYPISGVTQLLVKFEKLPTKVGETTTI